MLSAILATAATMKTEAMQCGGQGNFSKLGLVHVTSRGQASTGHTYFRRPGLSLIGFPKPGLSEILRGQARPSDFLSLETFGLSLALEADSSQSAGHNWVNNGNASEANHKPIHAPHACFHSNV